MGTLRVCEAEEESDNERKFCTDGGGIDDAVDEYGGSDSVPSVEL